MKAKAVASTLNNLGENFKGERFWNIQNWVNQLEISEKLERYYNVTHCRQLISSSVLYPAHFSAFMEHTAESR